MNSFANIDLFQTAYLYPHFYKLAFLTGFLIIISIGVIRKYPLDKWILMNAIASVFLIIGSKIGTFGLVEWQSLFETGVLLNTGRKTALAGLLFGGIALYFSKRILQFEKPFLDAYVWSVGISMVIARMGCMAAGCCYGLPYSGKVAVTYSGEGHLLYHQWLEGLISATEITTLSVHNVPAYFMLTLLIVLLIFGWLSRYIRNKTQLGLIGFALIMTARFVVEFFRDPITNHILGESFAGLKMIQWALLGIIAFLSVTAFLQKESKSKNISRKGNRIPVAILVITLLVFLLNGFFTNAEIAVLHLKLVLTILVLVFGSFKVWKPSVTWSPAMMILFSFFFMSQTYTFDPEGDNSSKVIIEASTSFGNFGEPIYPCTSVIDGCLGPVCGSVDRADPYGPLYNHLQIGIENRLPYKKRTAFLFGGGISTEVLRNQKVSNPHLLGHVFGYLGWEGKRYWGMKLGVRVGNIMYSESLSGVSANLVPMNSIWIGYKKYAVIESGIYNSIANGGSMSPLNLGLHLNTGNLIHDDFDYLKFGIAGSFRGDEPLFYGEARINLKHQWSIIPSFNLGLKDGDNQFYGLGVQYQLK